MSRNLLKAAIAAALVAGAASAAQAGGAGSVVNPYSPAVDHPYRHGVIETLDVHAAMQRWNRAHTMASNSKTLSFGGGTSGVGVLSGQTKAYIVFYGTQWGTASTDTNGNLKFTNDTAGAAGAAQQMFKGIGTHGETWSAELTQWCDGAGVSSGATSCPATGASYVPYQQNIFAGAWYDNSVASPSAASATQLANEAIKAAAHFGNTTAASNRYAYYMILSPKGTNPDHYQGSFCAWHDYTADAGVSSPYGEMAFSNQPYNLDSGSGCGVNFVNSGTAGKLDGFTMTLGHEWHEMVSDQFPSGGWQNHNSGTYSGQENSDECAWISAGSTGGAANIAFDTGTFAQQASYSNDTSSCAISHAIISHVTNVAPTANFSFVTSARKVTFTDSSTDSDGTIASYAWDFGDGGTSTTASPSHGYTTDNTYSVTETVTDNGGLTGSKTSPVTVAGSPPTANFSFVTSGLKATFTDSSTDTDSTIKQRAWDFGDGATVTAKNPVHTYASANTYSVTETVTDNSGLTGSLTAPVTVSLGGPTASFSFVSSGLKVNFTDASTDSNSTINKRTWDFGDGTTVTATNPVHTYASASSYSVTETVTDKAGLTGSTTTTVTVP